MKSQSFKAIPLAAAMGMGLILGSSAVLAQVAALPIEAESVSMLAEEHDGKVVYTYGGSEIGTIKDVIQASGMQGNHVIIALGGGRLDAPPRDVAVPSGEVSYSGNSARLTLDASRMLTRNQPIYETFTTTRVTE